MQHFTSIDMILLTQAARLWFRIDRQFRNALEMAITIFRWWFLGGQFPLHRAQENRLFIMPF